MKWLDMLLAEHDPYKNPKVTKIQVQSLGLPKVVKVNRGNK